MTDSTQTVAPEKKLESVMSWLATDVASPTAPADPEQTIGDWSQLLRDRRDALFALPTASPTLHQATVHYTIAGGAQIIHYVDPAKCSQPGGLYGAISITP